MEGCSWDDCIWPSCNVRCCPDRPEVNMPLSFWFRCGRRDRQRRQSFAAGLTPRWSAWFAYRLGWWFDAVCSRCWRWR